MALVAGLGRAAPAHGAEQILRHRAVHREEAQVHAVVRREGRHAGPAHPLAQAYPRNPDARTEGRGKDSEKCLKMSLAACTVSKTLRETKSSVEECHSELHTPYHVPSKICCFFGFFGLQSCPNGVGCEAWPYQAAP